MRYVGIDLHRRYMVLAVMTEEGRIEEEIRLSNDEEGICAFFARLPRPVRAVVESTGNWFWLYDLLDREGVDGILAHPLKVKAIASARLKNDRVDARMLAHLLRTGLLPESYVPSARERELRELIRYRAAVVAWQTRVKSRIRAALAKRNVTIEARSLMSKRARAELRALVLPPRVRQEIEECLGILDYLQEIIRGLNGQIAERATDSDEAQRLVTIPGIGFYLALLILAEIGPVSRFGSARKLASYAGLVPTTRSSGGHTYHGHITKQGSRWLRYAMVEAAAHVARRPGPLAQFYQRHKRRKGAKIARVALARKLITQVYWMLLNGETYLDVVRRLQATEVGSRLSMA